MSISSELEQRYSTEVDVDWWRGVILSHSVAGSLYLTDAPENQSGMVEGVLREFQAIPFQFVLPRRDAEGLQQLTLQICAIGREVLDLLEAALADPTERIVCRFGEWICGDAAQQWNPLLEMSLVDISVTEETVSATAMSADILNRPFPGAVYRTDLFPGLRH